MNGAADTVSTKIADHGKAVPADLPFDCASDFRDAEAGPGRQHGFGKCSLGARNEALGFFGHGANRHGDCSVGHEPIFFHGYIELHQVTFA